MNWEWRASKALLIGAALLLSSCGYQMGNCSWTSQRPFLSVPYVEGDRLGQMTSELVHSVSTSGQFCYRDCEADYELKVCLREYRDDHIGYRFDREGEEGRHRRRVLPTEGRVSIAAEVSVVDRCSCEVVLGPVLVDADVTFDFDTYANHSRDNIFSLGQINDRDVSRDLVFTPLYRELSKNIVDYITNTW